MLQIKKDEQDKSIDPNEIDDQTPLLPISDPNLFELDITSLSAENAAEQILIHIGNFKLQK
ncbi:MAG: hypothetical protein AB8U66_04605 [Rickettsiales endosymbiont of Dermacentor nuttalli]